LSELSAAQTSPFVSLEYFQSQFDQGLTRLLDQHKLGTFILVLANAMQNQNLYNQLKPVLLKQFEQFQQIFKQQLLDGNQLIEVEEDLLVFFKLASAGIDSIRLPQLRQEKHWQCQFNHLRSFRPARLSTSTHFQGLHQAYNDKAFNFNKPFLQSECFWSGDYSGHQVDLFYNKYPFANLHGLFVPQRKQCLPQFLTAELHHYMWSVSRSLQHIQGVGFGYNSYGAYASVNHLHFQMFIDNVGLPITAKNWSHNGGNDFYPVNVIKHTSSQNAWLEIEQLHKIEQPYNLLYRPDEIYIIPRKAQGTVVVPNWSSGFTWYELCGGILMFNQSDYQNIAHNALSELLAAVRCE